MFEQITALHQQVREYIEQLEPGYKVTSIDGYSTTNYMAPLGKQWEIHPDHVEYVHAFTDMRFRVSSVYLPDKHRKLSAEVHVMSDGTLHVGDRLVSI